MIFFRLATTLPLPLISDLAELPLPFLLLRRLLLPRLLLPLLLLLLPPPLLPLLCPVEADGDAGAATLLRRACGC